nr:unnamed protein product [Spirometra erinaceieuropaei]
MQAPARLSTTTIHDLPFADDRALNSKTEEDLQRSMDLFSAGCAHFELNISRGKAVLMRHQSSTTKYNVPRIRVNGTELKIVDTFNHLASTMSCCIRVGDEKILLL